MEVSTEKRSCANITILVITALVALWFCSPVSAQVASDAASPAQSIVIEPTFQDITLEEASASANVNVKIRNQTKTAQSFVVFAVDINQIDAQGNVTLSDKPIAGNNYALANFLNIEPPELILLPGEERELLVTIQNLQNLSPGGHYSAIVVKGVQSGEVKQGTTQTILPALSSFLLVRKKGGERFHISLKSSSMSERFWWWDFPLSINLLFENQGNVHVSPRGEVKIRDLFHRDVVEGTINEGSLLVLPESQREMDMRLRKIQPGFPIMLYTVSVNGHSDPGNVAFQQSFMIAVVSARILFISFVGCFGLLLIRKKLQSVMRKILRLSMYRKKS